MSIPYAHDIQKMANGGLQLNAPPDLIPPTKYAILTNAVSRVEGQLQTREGLSLICNVGTAPIHTIFRLNQFGAGAIGARLFGMDVQLFQAPLPAGNVPAALASQPFDGSPLSICAFRFEGDPQIWAIIANAGKMMKFKTGYYQQLGLPAPTQPALSSAGGAGLLNGSYDWRYTYVNSVTLSEGNPSPQQASIAPSTVYPNAFHNPDLTNGGNLFTNPSGAFNGDPAGATGTSPGGPSPSVASCTWYGFSNSGSPYSAVTLFVDSNASTSTLVGGEASVSLEYSLDGGFTWNSLYIFVATIIAARGRTIDQAVLPSGTDLSQLQVRSTCFSEPNAVATSNIYNISVVTVPPTGGSAGLSLTNQSAKLCVLPPTDPQEDHIRLYRRGGSLTDTWYFVSESVVSALSNCTGSSSTSQYAGTATDAGGPSAWTNPANATGAPDGVYATASVSSGNPTNPLDLTNYGFAASTSVIPVKGITVSVTTHLNTVPFGGFSHIQVQANLLLNGAIVGNTKSINLTSLTDVLLVFGGATDAWGASLTPAQIAGSTFGVRLQVTYFNPSDLTVYTVFIDAAQITVTPTPTLEIDDNAPDSQIAANPRLNIDNFMPVSSVQVQNQTLTTIWNYDERVLGCGDPARPESVYFSVRGNADQWPAENWVDVAPHGDQCMAGIVYSLRCFVFSRTRMSMLLPNIIQGATFTPAETSCRRGLKGRFALTAGEQGIYFVSNDGVYRTQGGPEESIIDDSIRPLFPTLESTAGVPVNGYDAIDMTQEDSLRMTYHNGEVWFDYLGLTTGLHQRLIFDERRNRWRGADYTPEMVLAYSEPGTTSSLLQGGADGDVYLAGNSNLDLDGPIAVQARTGSFDQGVPLNLKEYANVAVDIDPGGATVAHPVTITPYVNANAIPEAAVTVTGSGRQRVPIPLGDVYALNLSLDFSWNVESVDQIQPILYQTDIEYRREPSAQKHWEVPPTSFGLQGWGHIRDLYVTLRSTASVTLTVNTDTFASQTFTLASTGGAKQKIYVPMTAAKFKVVQIALDSASEFRLYSEDSEVRVKQWVTKLGYQTVPLIGVEQVGQQIPYAQPV